MASSYGSFGKTFAADVLKLIFNGTAIANVADNASSSPLTSLYVAWHTASPGEAGTQETSEADYGAYARTAVDRDTDGFTITEGSTPAAVTGITVASEVASLAKTSHGYSEGDIILVRGVTSDDLLNGVKVVASAATDTLTYTATGVADGAATGTITVETPSRCNPTAVITGVQCTSGSNTITHVSIGTAATGAGKVIFYGTLVPSIAVTTGVAPQITTDAAIILD